MISAVVIDSSVLVCALVPGDRRSEAAVRRLRSGDVLFAPALIDFEVVHTFRRLARMNKAIADRIDELFDDLARFPIHRTLLDRQMMGRVFYYRENLSAYDASYVALAEALGTTLVTADAKAAAAPTLKCAVEVIC